MFSKSTRMSCCERPITRSFTMVLSCGSWPMALRMWCSASSCSSRRAGSSSPTTVSKVAATPSDWAFTATFAAPPRRSSSRVTRTTGTGASGEIRSTAPNQ
jgi:hypothetical protein